MHDDRQWKNMDRYTITELRKEIEERREETMTDEQFAWLVAGFKHHVMRRGYYTAASVDNAVSRGWMSAQMAHFFKHYALE